MGRSSSSLQATSGLHEPKRSVISALKLAHEGSFSSMSLAQHRAASLQRLMAAAIIALSEVVPSPLKIASIANRKQLRSPRPEKGWIAPTFGTRAAFRVPELRRLAINEDRLRQDGCLLRQGSNDSLQRQPLPNCKVSYVHTYICNKYSNSLLSKKSDSNRFLFLLHLF